MRSQHKSINVWKIISLVLIGLIIGSGLWFAHAVLTPVDQPASTTTSTTSDPVMTVSLSKRQGNQSVTFSL